jgi:hypothetical protein
LRDVVPLSDGVESALVEAVALEEGIDPGPKALELSKFPPPSGEGRVGAPHRGEIILPA